MSSTPTYPVASSLAQWKKGQGYTVDSSNPFSIDIICCLSFLSVLICKDIR